MNLKYVPRRLCTPALHRQAVGHNGMALQFVEMAAGSPGLCVLVVSQNHAAVEFVPRCEQTFLIKILSQQPGIGQEHVSLGEEHSDSSGFVMGGGQNSND